ncbi:uncharacterized protein [Periplaneta americana]|uniref:uncharacterized protein isoform X1 n=1 Tax=Periplaneta americana TaxID=6978 RepID=UPI0037E91DE4
MSCKRVPQINRKGRGRIKCDYDNLNKLNFDKSSDSVDMCSKTVLQDNQDVIQISRNGDSLSELEISTSTNFSLHTQAEIVQDITGVGVDEWFKQRTESVSSIDLDTVMKTEVLESTYLSENIGHNFLSNKDVDMTCIVTNICDIGLSLDNPPNIADGSKSKQTECENTILNNYSSDQDPLLNNLDGSDLLDKDMLVENTGISNTHKPDLVDKSNKPRIPGNYVSESNEDNYSSIGVPSSFIKQDKEFKENLWNGSEINDTQPTIKGVKTKSNWESLSTTGKRSVDTDSEKDTGIDFPEFNLITFQIDTSDTLSNINQLPQVETSNKEMAVTATANDNVKALINKKYILPTQVDVSKKDDINSIETNNIKKSISRTCTATAPSCKVSVALPSNSRSLLKSPLKPSNITKSTSVQKPGDSSRVRTQTKTQELEGRAAIALSEEGSKAALHLKKTPSMAIIAISTDKSKNTTEIVINTPFGEQVFKGKTTDLMKATSGFWQKLDNNKIQKTDQPVTISTVSCATEQPPLLEVSGEQAVSLAADVQCDISEEGEEFGDQVTEDDQPVVEALAELGISVDKESVFCVTTGNGQKLWVCPVKDCGKMYPRQSMLKVHVLSHYNVRPFRCNFSGCHWSFYTYFKLKRHKETHLKRKDFVCPIKGCERRFTTIYNLNTHQKLHARPLEMVCPVETCAARFQTKRSLELHLKSHDRLHAPYKCSYEGCEKHYYSLNSLNSHSRSHQHKEEEVRCQWEGCGKLFDKPCRLKAHMRSHTGDKPYPCMYQDCGWAFSSASKLKRHQQKHTNERKFQCSVEGCGKSFMRSEHLKEHTLTHVGQRNFQCPFENCGVKFSAKSSLYVHLKKHNKTESEEGDKVLYHCPIEKCIRTYTCKSSLRQHMLKFHTPVLANDPSQLDYIALLTGDDDLTSLEGLQFSGDMTPTVSGGVSLVTPPSLMINGDNVGPIPPEYISTDFQFPTMLPSQICASENGSECSNVTSNSIITHVVLAQPDGQNPSFSIPTDVTDQTLSMPMFEPVVLDVDSGSSARTSVTYQDIMRERDRRKGNTSAPTDVVLGTGLQDIPHSFLLQDDLSNNQHTLYPEDHMMAAVGPAGVGEFQVLLLDSASGTRHEFAESTINLRDLE